MPLPSLSPRVESQNEYAEWDDSSAIPVPSSSPTLQSQSQSQPGSNTAAPTLRRGDAKLFTPAPSEFTSIWSADEEEEEEEDEEYVDDYDDLNHDEHQQQQQHQLEHDYYYDDNYEDEDEDNSSNLDFLDSESGWDDTDTASSSVSTSISIRNGNDNNSHRHRHHRHRYSSSLSLRQSQHQQQPAHLRLPSPDYLPEELQNIGFRIRRAGSGLENGARNDDERVERGDHRRRHVHEVDLERRFDSPFEGIRVSSQDDVIRVSPYTLSATTGGKDEDDIVINDVDEADGSKEKKVEEEKEEQEQGNGIDSMNDRVDIDGGLPHIPLRPFRNQVGGHSAIYKFTKRAVCKVSLELVLIFFWFGVLVPFDILIS